MKKKRRIVVSVIVSLAAVFVIFEIVTFSVLMLNRNKINGYLDKYDTGTATFGDVAAVNLYLKDYVKIGETENSDLVLSRSWWFFGLTVMKNYKKVDQLGTAFIYEDKDNNTYYVIETDEWCHFFRVYSVSKGVIK